MDQCDLNRDNKKKIKYKVKYIYSYARKRYFCVFSCITKIRKTLASIIDKCFNRLFQNLEENIKNNLTQNQLRKNIEDLKYVIDNFRHMLIRNPAYNNNKYKNTLKNDDGSYKDCKEILEETEEFCLNLENFDRYIIDNRGTGNENSYKGQSVKDLVLSFSNYVNYIASDIDDWIKENKFDRESLKKWRSDCFSLKWILFLWPLWYLAYRPYYYARYCSTCNVHLWDIEAAHDYFISNSLKPLWNKYLNKIMEDIYILVQFINDDINEIDKYHCSYLSNKELKNKKTECRENNNEEKKILTSDTGWLASCRSFCNSESRPAAEKSIKKLIPESEHNKSCEMKEKNKKSDNTIKKVEKDEKFTKEGGHYDMILADLEYILNNNLLESKSYIKNHNDKDLKDVLNFANDNKNKIIKYSLKDKTENIKEEIRDIKIHMKDIKVRFKKIEDINKKFNPREYKKDNK